MPVKFTVDERTRLGGRVAQLRRHHGDDAPQTIAAKQDLAEARIQAAVEKALSEAPPLRPEQADRLSVLLRGGAR